MILFSIRLQLHLKVQCLKIQHFQAAELERELLFAYPIKQKYVNQNCSMFTGISQTCQYNFF